MYSFNKWGALKNACLQINYLTLTLHVPCVVCSCQKSEHLMVTLFTPVIFIGKNKIQLLFPPYPSYIGVLKQPE